MPDSLPNAPGPTPSYAADDLSVSRDAASPHSPGAAQRPRAGLAYVRIARVDHWFKNIFMLLGVLFAGFYQPAAIDASKLSALALAFAATCLIASTNYVLNELLDAPTDRMHPEKRARPMPAGLVRPVFACLEWLLLGAAGFALALTVNGAFAFSALALSAMGIVYNVRPLRTKEWPYFDVLTEAFNNPVRLLLGWFVLIPDRFPPVSLIVAYWMGGAFLMATKRLAEYREIGDAAVAAAYRRSFRYYTPDRLLVSLLFYATIAALFAGIFIVRYHIELILFAPAGAGLFALYLKLGLRPNSPAQYPERLYRERAFTAYAIFCVVLFVLLMFSHVPWLYDWFNVEESRLDPLWTLGGR